jgi:hypothetical protein
MPAGARVHMLRNGGAPAETIVMQMLLKEAARKIDAPAPGTCRP